MGKESSRMVFVLESSRYSFFHLFAAPRLLLSLALWKLAICLLYASISFLPQLIWAQQAPCDRLQPLTGAFEYKYRGNRCEGLYVAKVGAGALDLISLTRGRLHYDLKPGTTLKVLVPSASEAVHVRAVAKIPNTYYRMDAVMQPGSILSWSVDDILLPQGLGADRIGVFAWMGDEASKTVLPVSVTVAGTQESKQTTTYLTVRPTFDVEKITWRSAPIAQGKCSIFGKWNPAAREQALGGQTVEISLSGLKGKVCVEVAAQSESSNDWSTLPLRLELTEQ